MTWALFYHWALWSLAVLAWIGWLVSRRQVALLRAQCLNLTSTIPSSKDLVQSAMDWDAFINGPHRSSKPMTPTQRSKFEAALTAVYAEQGLGVPPLATMDGDEYVSREVQSAWWGWLTASASVTVTLPSRVEHMTCGDTLGTERANGQNLMRKACVDALRAAGIRVEGEK